MSNKIENHVTSSFGRYSVLRGVMLADGLTKIEAEQMVGLPIEEFTMVLTSKLYEQRKTLRADIARLELTPGAKAKAQFKAAQAKLAKVDASLLELIPREVAADKAAAAVASAPIVPAEVEPGDEVGALQAELVAVCQLMDRSGAPTRTGCAKLIRIIDNARFIGASTNSATSLRLLIDRFMKLPISPSDKKLHKAGFEACFKTWIKRPAAKAAPAATATETAATA
jgi:hypothetical protein